MTCETLPSLHAEAPAAFTGPSAAAADPPAAAAQHSGSARPTSPQNTFYRSVGHSMNVHVSPPQAISRQTSQQAADSRVRVYSLAHGPILPKLLQIEEQQLFTEATEALQAIPGEFFVHDAHAVSGAVLGPTVQNTLASQGVLLTWRRPKDTAQVVDNVIQRPRASSSAASSAASSHGQWCLLYGTKLQAQDLKQGRLGNCYALAALFIVADCDASASSRLFHSLDTSRVGLYQVRLCLGGLWASVPVDDLLPTHHQHAYLVFASADRGQLWVSLVEKAMASVSLQGYSGLAAGKISEGLRLLTGAPVQQVYLSTGQTHEEWLHALQSSSFAHGVPGVHNADTRDALWVRILSYHSAGFALGASCGLHTVGPAQAESSLRHELTLNNLACDSLSSIQALGLIPNHAYAVTAVFEMPPSTGEARGAATATRSTAGTNWDAQRRFVQLRNPHGSCSYSGPWNFHSELWTAQRRQMCGVQSAEVMKSAGIAIVPFEIFLKCFATLTVAKLHAPQTGWSRVAACVQLPQLQLQHRLQHAMLHRTLEAADTALHTLWAPLSQAHDAVQGLLISAESAGAADIVLARPPKRFAYPAATSTTNPLRHPLQGAHHVSDLAIVIIAGDLSTSCPRARSLRQLQCVAFSPRTSWMDTVVLETHFDAQQTYSVIPLSFSGLGVVCNPKPASLAAAGSSPGSARDAAGHSGSITENALTSGFAGTHGEPPAACLEVHSAAAVLVEARAFSMAVLRKATLAAALQLGKTKTGGSVSPSGAESAAGRQDVLEWFSREAGAILVAINESPTEVFSVEVEWASSTQQSTSNLTCTRGASGRCKDTLLPMTAQILAIFSVAQGPPSAVGPHDSSGAGGAGADNAEAGAWSFGYRSTLSRYSVHSFQRRERGIESSWPPVQGTLHEPEPLE